MLLNPLGFNLGTRGHLGGLGFRGGHGGICWLVSLFHMLLNPLGFNLGTRGHLGGLGFEGGHGGICWLVSLFHMLLNPLGFNLGTRGHLGGLGFGGDMGAYVDLSLNWHMLLNPLGVYLGTRGHLGDWGTFRGGLGGICQLATSYTCLLPHASKSENTGTWFQFFLRLTIAYACQYIDLQRSIHSVLLVDSNGCWNVASKVSSKLLELDLTTSRP